MKRYRNSGFSQKGNGLEFGRECRAMGQSVNGISDLNNVVASSPYPALGYLFLALAILTQSQ